MPSRYDLTNINSCIGYLADLVQELDASCFKQNVTDAFAPTIAQRAIDNFQDKLLIPLGQMKSVLEKAQDVTNRRFTPAEKIQYARDNTEKVALSAQMESLFSYEYISDLSRIASALAAKLEHRMNQLDNADAHSERDLQDQQNLTNRLAATAQALTKTAERLGNNATFFDVEYKAGIGGLYDNVKAFEKSLDRGRRKS